MNRTPDRPRRDDEAPEREGDVLGISDADPDIEIPFKGERGKGHPAGIEVRDRATGLGDVPQRSGATGIDMGAGGEGTHVSSTPQRPPQGDREDEDE